MVENIANSYLGLGISGAALFIVLISTYIQNKQNSKFMTNWQQAMNDMQKRESKLQNDKLDKLCDKIDELVTATAANTKELSKNLLSNDKDQKTLVNKLDSLMELSIENQRRISRIDDRTYQCLGNGNKKGEDN